MSFKKVEKSLWRKNVYLSSIIASGVGVKTPRNSELVLYLSNLIGKNSPILLVNMKK